MSEKLIYADELLKRTVLAGEIRNPHMEVIPAYFVREAPAVEAVEVVRCKDCKYAKDPGAVAQRYGEPGLRTCKNGVSIANRRLVSPKDFCPYGVRRPENMIEKPWEEGNCEKCIHCVDGNYCSVYMLGMNYYFCPHVRDCEKFVERREENAVD